MPFIICVIIAFVLIGMSNASKNAKNDSSKNKPITTKRQEWNIPNLNHSECDYTQTSCLHEENINKEENVCKACGFQNEKGKKNCSLCGRRLK